MLAPKKPVKVGESWNPDVKAIVHGMFDAEMSEGVDLAKSTCKFTLKSVETRAGAEFGKIEGTLVLSLAQFGPMKLDAAVALKMAMDLDANIDGKLPDGLLKVKAEMKGKSSAPGPNGRVDLDITMTGQTSVKTTK